MAADPPEVANPLAACAVCGSPEPLGNDPRTGLLQCWSCFDAIGPAGPHVVGNAIFAADRQAALLQSQLGPVRAWLAAVEGRVEWLKDEIDRMAELLPPAPHTPKNGETNED